MLALIGQQWVNARDHATGQRRLENPSDFVRIEIREAFKQNIPVIPVLLDGATMPQSSSLPDDLDDLTRRQAALIGFNNFEADVSRLIRSLGLSTKPRTYWRNRLAWGITSLLALALLTLWAMSLQQPPVQQPTLQGQDVTSTDQPESTSLFQRLQQSNTSNTATSFIFDPATEEWAGKDIFDIDGGLEIKNDFVFLGRENDFEARLVAEYPGRRVYRFPEKGVLVENPWASGTSDVLQEPLLRTISSGSIITKLPIEAASLNRPNGLIAGVSTINNALIQVFDAGTGRLVHSLPLPPLDQGEDVERVDFSSDGTRLFVTGTLGNWVSMQLMTGTEDWRIRLPFNDISFFSIDIHYSPDGTSAYVFGENNPPQRVRLEDGALLEQVTSPPYNLNSMAFHPNAVYALYSSSADGLLCFGQTDVNADHYCFGDEWGDVFSPGIHHSGRFATGVFYDRGVVVYDLELRQPLAMIVPEWKVYRAEFEPNSDMMIIHSANKSTLWELSLPY